MFSHIGFFFFLIISYIHNEDPWGGGGKAAESGDLHDDHPRTSEKRETRRLAVFTVWPMSLKLNVQRVDGHSVSSMK